MVRYILSCFVGILFSTAAFAAGSWTKKTDFPKVRWGAPCFSIGDKGYAGTGGDTTAFWNDFWEYNSSSDSWSQKATFPGAGRMFGTGFSIGDKGYMGLGVWYGGYYAD